MTGHGRWQIKHLRHAVEIVAILAAGFWAFYLFIYEERIKPLHESPRLSLTVHSNVSNSNSTFQLVTIRLALRNVGNASLDLAGQYFNIYGERVAQHRKGNQPGPPDWDVEPEYSFVDGPLLLAQGRLRDGAVGGIRDSHMLLRSNESAEISATVIVRRHRFVALKVDYGIVPGKAPIVPKIKLTATRNHDGSITLDGPEDDGEEIIPL